MISEVLVACLAWNVYFEARGEPIAGQFAVAEVTLRRAAASNRPVCNEVFTDAQFSWTHASDNLAVRDRVAWAKAVEVAKAALLRDTNYSLGATHFHALRVRPAWARKLCKTTQIGKHVFYKACP